MKEKSLKTNFIMNIILTLSSFLFPMITFPYVSRILLPVGTGKVSLATSVVLYFNMLAQLGIPTYGIRACAKVRDDFIELSRTVHELLIVNFFMSLISYGSLFILVTKIAKLYEEKLLYVIMSATIILSVIGIEWMYKGLEKYKYITIRSLVFKLIALIAMFLLIHKETDYVIYGGISIFASSVSNILNLINAHKYIAFHPVGNYNIMRHFKPITVFFAMSCAITVYTNLDVIMLGFMKTNVDVGYYNAAVKIKTILVSIVTALGSVLLPRASYYIENGYTEEFFNISKKALNFVIIFALPMVFFFLIYAQEGVYFLSGEAYKGSIIPMKIIMPSVCVIGFSNILGIQMLVPLGKEKIVLYSVFLGAIIDLILNFLLIPKYASSGAAVGTLAAEIVVLVVQGYYLKNIIFDLVNDIRFGIIMISIIVSSILSYFVRYLFEGNFITLLVGGAVFYSTFIILMLLTKEKLSIEIYLYLKNYITGTINRKKDNEICE